MRSSLELSGEVRSHPSLAHSIVGFLFALDGLHLLVSLTVQFSCTISSFDEEGRPSMTGLGLSATYHLVWRCFECWWPLGVHSMAVSMAPNCGMFESMYAVSLVSQGWSPVGLPSVVIQLGNNLAKLWSGITLPLVPWSILHWRFPKWFWAYFSRHGDSCPSFSECINVDCSGVDKEFITLGIIVIAYINTVGLLLFSTIVSMSWWLLVWILLSTRGASASGIPVTNFATRLAGGVLGMAGGFVRCMGFCAIPTSMLVLGFRCFLLLLLGARLRSSAPFVDSIDSFGSKAHSREVVCYGYVSPACLKHLGCCGLEVKGEQFLDQLIVCEGTD